MRTTILETYSMLVCLICVICLIVLASVGLYDMVQIVFPEFTSGGPENALSERQCALRSIVIVIVMFIVNMIAFLSHWKIGKKARGEAAPSSGMEVSTSK